MEMKIAIATEDGTTVSTHFGKAPYYVVVKVSEGKVFEREIRAKAYHGNHQEYGHNHADMFTCIADCQVLIVGGMGTPAHEAALAHGLKVVPTNPRDISAVIASYLDGTLEENPSLIHTPGAH
jgi:predicted Fe-Mo cluster-binding NifX family protein